MRIQPVYILSLLLFVGVLFVSKLLYDEAERSLRHEAIQAHHHQTEAFIDELISKQRRNSMTLTLTLAENPLAAELLQGGVFEQRSRLSELVKRLNRRDEFKDLWVQLINLQGNSIYRSWTERVGDNLSRIRPEINTLFQTGQPRQVISVGKFTVSFKSMVPVKDPKGRLLGLIEVITHFTPLTRSLFQAQGARSVMLVDKAYHSQLIRAEKSRFIEGYYVANGDAPASLVQWIGQFGPDRLAETSVPLLSELFVVSRVPIAEKDQNFLAHWFVFTPYEKIDFTQTTWVLEKYLYISVAVILLLLLLLSLYLRQHQLSRDKRYYRQIIDSVPDIIYITNGERIVDVNRHFFEFFDQFSDLKSFLKRHRCVCDLFVKAPGYLSRRVDGYYWLDYVLGHPEKRHKAKIHRHGQDFVFLVKIKRMTGLKTGLYNVLLQDISQVEAYEKKLKHLSVTDELTGVGNRLACNKALKRELQRAHRYETLLCLIMYDLDYFKEVNDAFGHDVGDLVLINLTHQVQKMLRETDVLCRFGGEEFLVILPQTGQEEAVEIADRLRETISHLNFNEVPAGVTISLGVAQANKWDTEQTLLKRADNALYQAKRNGRNRVEVTDLTSVP